MVNLELLQKNIVKIVTEHEALKSSVGNIIRKPKGSDYGEKKWE